MTIVVPFFFWIGYVDYGRVSLSAEENERSDYRADRQDERTRGRKSSRAHRRHRRHGQCGQSGERLISFPVCPFGRSPALQTRTKLNESTTEFITARRRRNHSAFLGQSGSVEPRDAVIGLSLTPSSSFPDREREREKKLQLYLHRHEKEKSRGQFSLLYRSTFARSIKPNDSISGNETRHWKPITQMSSCTRGHRPIAKRSDANRIVLAGTGASGEMLLLGGTRANQRLY